MIQISKKELLKFYDEKGVRTKHIGKYDASPGSHVSAITGLIGEDLVLGLFQHYWEKKCDGNTSEILSYHCREEKPRKHKLDAWLLCTTAKGRRTLYQTEIKNWSSHSRGMGTYQKPENNAKASERWQRLIESGKNEALSKVTFTPRISDIKDKKDTSGKKVNSLKPKPLLCMWSPFATKTANNECFFKENDRNRDLCGVDVFSASLYLRSPNTNDQIHINAPRVTHRLRLLNNIMHQLDQS